MIPDVLEPSMELLREEYVLVQAWKKTASYIRYHNWYSDTLELDRAAVNLPRFLGELAERLREPHEWANDPLRMVPAPKSQEWHVKERSTVWEPIDKDKTATKIRPLAHASLKDQVAATALMLCVADRVESAQGDPRVSITNPEVRKRVVSYGNRLFCDQIRGQLRHRWGSEKLYRAYFQDYRRFLSRPDIVAEGVTAKRDARVLIVHSDLRQFYDRVRPTLLAHKIDALRKPGDDGQFYSFAHRLLKWEWDQKDERESRAYKKHAELPDFSTVALPQGLVASGFFANLTLLDFDEALRGSFSHSITPSVRILDICRYVDDLRVVLEADSKIPLADVTPIVSKWIQSLLDRHAHGLLVSGDKTQAAEFRGDEHPLVLQSQKMEGIQSAISGGFDAIGGEEVLNAVQGLLRAQQRYSKQRPEGQVWPLSPLPDVRDETVARFAAARFRSTYRSLRPLLEERQDGKTEKKSDMDVTVRVRSRAELDDEARTFALGLIENWVKDPSNVRLLRIGLDLWPEKNVLNSVLDLLRPFTRRNRRTRSSRLVAWYCLAEIFRAAATETGLVEDGESLPEAIEVTDYRDVLRKEAVRLLKSPLTLPWYVRQQVLLFLAVSEAIQSSIRRASNGPETGHYFSLLNYLAGKSDGLRDVEFASSAILSRRAFRGRENAVRLARARLDAGRLEQIARRDPSFALEIINSKPGLSRKLSLATRNDLCLNPSSAHDEWQPLPHFVLKEKPDCPLRNEFTLLSFAWRFLGQLAKLWHVGAIPPSAVFLKLSDLTGPLSEVSEVRIVSGKAATASTMYRPPGWVSHNERWRFHLGFLLRFILSARQDFTQFVRPAHWRELRPCYRPAQSHWYQRLYGHYSGHSAFGDDWLPVSDWIERLLLDLLRWPGCRASGMTRPGRSGIEYTRNRIRLRLRELRQRQGDSGSVFMLPLIAPRPYKSSAVRPLRACIVQTVIPTPKDFTLADLSLSEPMIRNRHRNHLSAALASVERMLALRETHLKRDGRLDWLILPELSVHPRDVRTHLVPFARKYKTIILAGLTYEALFPGQPLVNSAVWIIPDWSATHGLQILIRRQGKHYLAPEEKKLNAKKQFLGGFRPCQWLLGYDWSRRKGKRPLWLTASVCYDATDLALVADLRNCSDVFAIPSLNKDVRTFDQMALALHYHMFQLVIVANNGIYGGSNAYAPYQEAHVKQIFHLHGQPQASIAFLEIDDIQRFLDRKSRAKRLKHLTSGTLPPVTRWKFPPAGM